MSKQRKEQTHLAMASIQQNTLGKKQSLQKTIKEKDLNRILYDQDDNCSAEDRIQHIQESINKLPSYLLKNHLHLPRNVIQNQQTDGVITSQGSSLLKQRPILTENMQQSIKKIRSALTPLNSKISTTATINKQNQSYDENNDRTYTNQTAEFKVVESNKEQITSKYSSLSQNHPKPPLSNGDDQYKKSRTGSISVQNNGRQLKSSYDISQQPTSRNSKTLVSQPFKNNHYHNQSYTTRASTARSNTNRQVYIQTTDNNSRLSRKISDTLKQQSFDMKSLRQNSFSINNSLEYLTQHNEKKSLDCNIQVQNYFSQCNTPHSQQFTNRPQTSQTYVVPSSHSLRPSTHLKSRKNTYKEQISDQQIDLKQSSRISINPIEDLGHTEQIDQSRCYGYGEEIDNQIENNANLQANNQTNPVEQKLQRRFGIIDMKKVNNNVEYLNQYTQDFLPAWIRKRPDFIKVHLQSQITKKLIIPKICLKQMHERYISDLKILEEYLRKIKQLQDLSQDLMISICQNLKVKICWEGEKMLSYGQDISFMFLIFEGELIQQKDTNTKILKEGELYFRNALIRQTKSEHEYIAKCQCIILYIERKDYQEVLVKQQERIINNFKIDIIFQTLFKDFPKETLTKLCEALSGRLYLKDEVVYEFQDSPQNFYIIYEGEIRCETVFYMLNQNCWPKVNQSLFKDLLIIEFNKTLNQQEYIVADHDYHEYRTFSKTLKNEKILGKGSFFGDQEVIYDLGRMASTVAHTNCFLLSITKQQFFNIFTYKEINMFIQYRQNAPIKLEKNLKSIQKDQKNKETVIDYFFNQYTYQRKRIMSALNILYESAPSSDKVEKIEQKIKAFKQYIENKDFNESEEN